MEIPLKDLRLITNRLLDYVESLGPEAIDLDEADYYWIIDQGQLYDPTKDPTDLTLGQLSDDWTELARIRNNESPPIAYALVWLSAIMRAIGQKVVR